MKSRMSRREFLLGIAGKGDRTAVPDSFPSYVDSLKETSTRKTRTMGLTDMSVADTCTLCNACAESCSERAITMHEGEMFFHSEKCTGCGDCIRICPEHSITLSELDNPREPSSALVYKDEMIRCTSCNINYVSAKMLKKLVATLQNEAPRGELCPNCRRSAVYPNIVGTTLDTYTA